MSKHFAQTDPAPEKSHRRAWIAAGAVAGGLAAAYLGGALYFSNVFFPNTTVDGLNASLVSGDDLAAMKAAEYDGWVTEVSGDDISLSVLGSDVSLALDRDHYASSVMGQQNAWTWPVAVTQVHELSGDVELTLNEAAIRAMVEPVISASAEAHANIANGGIAFDEAASRFVMPEGAKAQFLNEDVVVQKIADGMRGLQHAVELGQDCYVREGTVHEALDQANRLVGATTTLTLNGKTAFEVTPKIISGWVRIGDDLSVSLDTAAIDSWCHGELSEKLDTLGTERRYKRPDGKECVVNDGTRRFGTSFYGWSIDGGKTAELLAAAIQGGTAGTLEVPVFSAADRPGNGGQDWPDRYIDLDITEQHARFYDNGTLIWEADVVTGQENDGHETQTGVWTITSREQGDINLRGAIDPETNEPEWDSHVNFWMGVIRNEAGFHNAPWRGAFGGDIYTWYGSHGCINLSYESAEALYGLVQVGDVVVIHK